MLSDGPLPITTDPVNPAVVIFSPIAIVLEPNALELLPIAIPPSLPDVDEPSPIAIELEFV